MRRKVFTVDSLSRLLRSWGVASLVVASTARAAVVHLSIVDGELGAPVEYASILFVNAQGAKYGFMSDADGRVVASIPDGQWTVKLSSVGYKASSIALAAKDTTLVTYKLLSTYNQLGEVVVTAKESTGPTSSSLIDRQAMTHLQPSSFTDLLELVPGNVSSDPNMGSANTIKLREAANSTSSDNYSTSSLGTSFVIDGVPMNTNADLQVSLDDSRNDRSSVGKGVDMRSLSTDDIEKVEIVRGIASVEYGDLTSGLVNIKRKTGITRLEARFKADSQSQLFYLGKGFSLGGKHSMNVSLDYLDSKIDPRNNRENFKRVTASARALFRWDTDAVNTSWQSSLNYTGTRERDDNDPDLTVNGTVDSYSQSNDALSFNNIVTFLTPRHSFFRRFVVTQGLSYAYDKVHQEKTIASSRIYPMPVSMTQGDNYVDYLPMLYDAELDVIGQPLTAFAKASLEGKYTFGVVTSTLKAGVEWSMSKNYGAGQVYDIMRPIVAGNTQRPRAFSDIPAMHQQSSYIENTSNIHLGNHAVQVALGLRQTMLLHLDKAYALAGKSYIDPRVNIKWTLPSTSVAGYDLGYELAGGYGLMTKMPVAAYLYPNLRYTDYAQLNYYHNVEEYRTMNVKTFVEDLTNYDLKAARNTKWEIRGDITYRGNRLSVTYFKEDMKDGFRATPVVHSYTYNVYDATSFDPYAANRAPLISELPYTTETRLATVSHYTNSSQTRKQGVEYTFSSCRIPVIRTRVTVTGAYLKTTQVNSQPLWYKPSVILNGKELTYAGLYDDTDGTVYQSFNTNFTFDTDIPRLGLNFSISAQNMWFTTTQSLYRSGIPTHYTDETGNVYEYTADMMQDAYLQHLVRNYTSTTFDQRRVPVATNFNFKATKTLWHERIGIALYVNRIISITPDYYLYGQLRRRYTSPYFGMEINFKL